MNSKMTSKKGTASIATLISIDAIAYGEYGDWVWNDKRAVGLVNVKDNADPATLVYALVEKGFLVEGAKVCVNGDHGQYLEQGDIAHQDFIEIVDAETGEPLYAIDLAGIWYPLEFEDITNVDIMDL